MKFRDSVIADDATFFCDDEFAEKHVIESIQINCIIDTITNAEDFNHEHGMIEIRIYIPQEEASRFDDGFFKEEGESLNVDGAEYIIQSRDFEMGVHVVHAYRYRE